MRAVWSILNSMRKLLTLFGVPLLITAVALSLMCVIPIKSNAKPLCCDQLTLKTSYGFPFPFKQIYTGGLTGHGDSTTTPRNVAIDSAIVFAASAIVLGIISAIRKRPA